MYAFTAPKSSVPAPAFWMPPVPTRATLISAVPLSTSTPVLPESVIESVAAVFCSTAPSPRKAIECTANCPATVIVPVPSGSSTSAPLTHVESGPVELPTCQFASAQLPSPPFQ